MRVKYVFEDFETEDVEKMNEHLDEVIVNRYPELVHSDFDPCEEPIFEELWLDVEEVRI